MEVSSTERLQLVSRSRAQDEALLAEVQPLVVRTVRLVVGAGSGVAEDAAQEALFELIRSLPRLKDARAAPAFAARIATRERWRNLADQRRAPRLAPWLGELGERIGETVSAWLGSASRSFLPMKSAKTGATCAARGSRLGGSERFTVGISLRRSTTAPSVASMSGGTRGPLAQDRD